MSQLAFTRPRSITEIIDATFRFYRARFGDLVVLAAILLVPPALIAAIVPASLERATLFATNLMYAITNGAIAFLVAAALERNETLSASDVLRQFGSRTGNVLGVAIATGVAAVIGFLLLIVPGHLRGFMDDGCRSGRGDRRAGDRRSDGDGAGAGAWTDGTTSSARRF